jgi:hypothetical protein
MSSYCLVASSSIGVGLKIASDRTCIRPAESLGRLLEPGQCGLRRNCALAFYSRLVPDPGDEEFGAQIPIFASVPSKLDVRQAASKGFIYRQLRDFGLHPRTVGASDKAVNNPLHEVRTLARHCAGGIILGYEQVSARQVLQKSRDTDDKIISKVLEEYLAPTPWNQLETGILFGLGLPLLVLRERGIAGGIFDEGASDVLIQDMPMPGADWAEGDTNLQSDRACRDFKGTLMRWQARVRQHYYGDC